MNKYLIIVLSAMLTLGISQMALAGEHGGKEHGGEAKKSGSEHGGTAKGNGRDNHTAHHRRDTSSSGIKPTSDWVV